VAWTSVVGLLCMLADRRRRPFAVATLLSSAIVLQVASAPLDWNGAASFGARRLVGLVPLMIVASAAVLEIGRSWLEARRQRLWYALSAAAVLPLGVMTLGEVWGLPRSQIAMSTGLRQSQLYGEGVKIAFDLIEMHVGDLAIWPAEQFFSWRYGLPALGFREATEDRYYRRSYRDLSWSSRELSLKDEALRRQLAGFEPVDDGVRLTRERGSLVFAASWPYATTMTIDARSGARCRVRVGFGGLLGERIIGDLDLDPDESRSVTLPIAADLFDSGLNEIVFRTAATSDCHFVLQAIRLDDTASYPSAL
jgi:hypothetical protein